MRKYVLTYSLIPILAFALSACSLFGPVKTPNITTYVLASSGIPKVVHPIRATLLVATPTAAAGYQNDDMMYVNYPFELKSFATHKWVATPAKMLLPLIVQQIRGTHHFHAVVSPPFNGHTDFRLEIQLVKLQQNFLMQPSQLQMHLQAQLIETAHNRIISDRDFKIEIPAPSNNPQGGAIAANEATAILLNQIGSFVIRSTYYTRT